MGSIDIVVQYHDVHKSIKGYLCNVSLAPWITILRREGEN